MALTDGLELAINFNSDVLDKSGNGRNGTVDGMTYDTSTPIIGSGTGVFDGINDDVEIDVASSPQSDILDLTVGTIALWTRFSTIAEYKILFSISQAGPAFPNSDEWGIAFRGDSSNKIQVFCINAGSIIMSALTPANAINDNDKHLIIVRAKSSGNIEILVDDVLQTPLTGSPLGTKFFGHAVDADTMRIGSIERDTISYTGSKDTDALAIWDRPLINAEGTEYYNVGDGVELEVVVVGIPILRRRMEGY
jgi:hypothetical protein